MVEIELEYKGDLRCEAVHGPSHAVLHTDAPVDNQGKGEAFSPTDLVATALGACMLTIMGIVSRREGIALEGTRVKVGKEMSATPPRRIAKITVAFEMSTPVTAEQQEKLRNAAMTCPVHKSLSPEIQTPITFNWK